MDNNRLEEAKEIVESMEKSSDLSKIEEMIRNNKVQFEYEGKQYRCRLLNNFEKDELNKLRVKKFNSMLQEKDENDNYVFLTEKALIKQLKERGDIDLDATNEEIKKLESEESALQLKLGEAIANNSDDKILEEYKKQIEDLRIKKMVLNTQKTLILEFSLENQLLNYVSKVITMLSTDILIDEEWKKLWNSVEEFEKEQDNNLVEVAAKYAMILQYM